METLPSHLARQPCLGELQVDLGISHQIPDFAYISAPSSATQPYQLTSELGRARALSERLRGPIAAQRNPCGLPGIGGGKRRDEKTEKHDLRERHMKIKNRKN